MPKLIEAGKYILISVPLHVIAEAEINLDGIVEYVAFNGRIIIENAKEFDNGICGGDCENCPLEGFDCDSECENCPCRSDDAESEAKSV